MVVDSAIYQHKKRWFYDQYWVAEIRIKTCLHKRTAADIVLHFDWVNFCSIHFEIIRVDTTTCCWNLIQIVCFTVIPPIGVNLLARLIQIYVSLTGTWCACLLACLKSAINQHMARARQKGKMRPTKIFANDYFITSD